jgi:hypothetical protein
LLRYKGVKFPLFGEFWRCRLGDIVGSVMKYVIFFKAAFNVLPPHRLYNYKIEIKPSKKDTLNYSPLHQ